MLTVEQMQKLKKVNISKDVEKSKTRMEKDYKSTTSVNKKAIVNLSGLKRATFYRAFETGAATAKVVLSMAQTLNVSPYYYIGAEDEKGTCTDEVVTRFLQEHGYGNLIQEMKNAKGKKPKRRYNRKPKPNAEEASQSNTDEEPNALTEPDGTPAERESEATNDVVTFTVALDDSRKMRDAIENLSEESAVLLLKALFKRAEANENAETLCDMVKRCLLS